MIYLELFWSFFQVGLFSIGGGYAAMPLIQDQVVDIPWLEHCAGGFGRAAPRCDRYDCLCRYLVDDSGTIRPTYSSSRFEQL